MGTNACDPIKARYAVVDLLSLMSPAKDAPRTKLFYSLSHCCQPVKPEQGLWCDGYNTQACTVLCRKLCSILLLHAQVH
eukprot:8611928-Karenia_brevis.AAC.1